MPIERIVTRIRKPAKTYRLEGGIVVVSHVFADVRPFRTGTILLGRVNRRVDTSPWTTKELERGARVRS